MTGSFLLIVCARFRLFLFVLPALFLIPVTATAQAPLASKWETDCNEKRCLVSRSLSVAGQNRKFLTMILLFDKTNNENLMVLSTPLGIAVEPGVQAVIGDNIWNASVKACFPNGCEAVHLLTDADLSLVRSKDGIDVRYFPYGSDKPLSGIVPLNGLEEALTAIGK